MAPKERRQQAWDRLESDLDRGKLTQLTTIEPMSELSRLGPKIIEGKTRGRVVIDVNQ